MARRHRRMHRVDELLKEEIAGILREMKDPRVGFLTVMDVETSPDLRHARVYVSVLGEEEEKQEAMEALRSARGWVRARVGQEVTLKFLPEIHFELDRTLERAARIEELIDEMRSDVEGADSEAPAEPDESPEPEDDEAE